MQLLKNIISVLQVIDRPLSESEIKKQVGKVKRDYGCTNVTLKRLMRHGVLTRTVGICETTKRPSFLFNLKMDYSDVRDYVIAREFAVSRAKARRFNNGSMFNFGEEFTVNLSYNNKPVVIGMGLAPEGEQGCWLVPSTAYEVVTKEHNGRTIVGFKKRF